MRSKVFYIIMSMVIMFLLVGCTENSTVSQNNEYLGIKKVSGVPQIRFKDLVELKDLEQYNNMTVSAVGYLSPILAYDNSFGYLMNLPYQTCPYCIPDDGRITNTIAIFAKDGKKIDYTESAIVVTGTLKLENYTDDYGYEYAYRLTDVSIEEADTSAVGDKITAYNQIADKKVLSNIMDALYALDNNVFCKEYMQAGYNIKVEKVDTNNLKQTIEDLKNINNQDLDILRKVAENLVLIADSTNALIEKEDLNSLEKYEEKILECFDAINNWMAKYEL